MTAIVSSSMASGPAIEKTKPVIQCRSLTKVFRDFWLRNKARAVDHLDLDIHQGEVFGLLGPNGSGKSTTIKMILGLLHPTAGQVLVMGKRPDDVATKANIGYLPEETYLYRFLNAYETLDYYGRLFHLPRSQRKIRIAKLLEMVGLSHVAHRAVGEYSKGMQRKIGLAQALINDPSLLILDEPTTGLDPIGTRQFKDLIIQLAHGGKTILMCSHLLGDVEDVCDRVAIMFGGKIKACDSVAQLLTRQDATTLYTTPLDPQVIQQIESMLQNRGGHIQKVEHPRQRLEDLFLQIVQQAQAQGADTSGARSGGPIADFLNTGPNESQAPSNEVIHQLLTPAQPTPVAQSPEPITPTVVVPVAAMAPAKPVAPTASTTKQTSSDEEPPTQEELDLIRQLGSQWQQESAAPAKANFPPTGTPAKNTAPADLAPAGEQPDRGFLDALMQAPPEPPEPPPPEVTPESPPPDSPSKPTKPGPSSST